MPASKKHGAFEAPRFELDLRQKAQREALVRERSRIYGAGRRKGSSQSPSGHQPLQRQGNRAGPANHETFATRPHDHRPDTLSGTDSHDADDNADSETLELDTSGHVRNQDDGGSPGRQLRLVSTRRLPTKSHKHSSRRTPGSTSTNSSDVQAQPGSTHAAALERHRSYQILLTHESNFAAHRSKMLSQFITLRKRLDGQHQRLLEAVKKSATHYEDVDELLQQRHDKLSQSLALLLGGVDLAQNNRNFKILSSVSALSDELKALRTELQDTIRGVSTLALGASAGPSVVGTGGVNPQHGTSDKGGGHNSHDGTSDGRPTSPLDLDAARELGLLSPKKSTPNIPNQNVVTAANSSSIGNAVSALSAVEASLKSSVKQLSKQLKRQKEESKSGSKVRADALR